MPEPTIRPVEIDVCPQLTGRVVGIPQRITT